MRVSAKHSALICLTVLFLSGCATTPGPQINAPWMEEVRNYQSSLGPNHKDSLDNLFSVTPEMRAAVQQRFGKMPNLRAARKLALWLLDDDGRAMEYDIDANLTPTQAYQQSRGNCLSFTLLLVQLASELGIKLNVNEVDMPDMWGQNEEENLVFYRHVNAIFDTHRYTQIFDLAMEQYERGFPQRYIEKSAAAALLYSNIGIEKLHHSDFDGALHYLKLAVSISPDNSDLWINLGAVFRRGGQVLKAEQAYLQAVSLNDRDSIAASNLERLYREQGRHTLADQYQKLAYRARQRNPYLFFFRAKEAFTQQDYALATKSIRRAIRLHKDDPKFYELRGRINLVNQNYIAAVRDLEKAHNISKDIKERDRYANKVEMILASAQQQAEKRRRRFNIDAQSWR